MKEIEKIGKTLKFLEEKLDVNFQLKILDNDSELNNTIENRIDDIKSCYSAIHNTDKLICFHYNKKNF